MASRGGFRVALVGAGHGHLHLLRKVETLRRAGVEPVLVAPQSFHYSGLTTGVLSGALDRREAEVDVSALAARAGVEHHIGEATSIDLEHRRLGLSGGETLGFDIVSLNVGSVTRDPRQLAGHPGVWAAKPLSQLFQLREVLEEAFRRGIASHIVVAGGGQSGFEIAAAAMGLAERHGLEPVVFLVAPVEPTWAPKAAISHLTRSLQRRGVVFMKAEVVAREADSCLLSNGERLSCGLLVLASGLEAPPIVRSLGLPMSADGRLRVSPTLQSIADPAVYAVGDCCLVEGAPRPAAGVFGVRAAPILLRNIARRGEGPPVRYRPQTRWLSVMDLGDGTGMAVRGRAWWSGPSALWLKRELDLRFVRRVRGRSTGRPGAVL